MQPVLSRFDVCFATFLRLSCPVREKTRSHQDRCMLASMASNYVPFRRRRRRSHLPDNKQRNERRRHDEAIQNEGHPTSVSRYGLRLVDVRDGAAMSCPGNERTNTQPQTKPSCMPRHVASRHSERLRPRQFQPGSFQTKKRKKLPASKSLEQTALTHTHAAIHTCLDDEDEENEDVALPPVGANFLEQDHQVSHCHEDEAEDDDDVARDTCPKMYGKLFCTKHIQQHGYPGPPRGHPVDEEGGAHLPERVAHIQLGFTQSVARHMQKSCRLSTQGTSTKTVLLFPLSVRCLFFYSRSTPFPSGFCGLTCASVCAAAYYMHRRCETSLRPAG